MQQNKKYLIAITFLFALLIISFGFLMDNQHKAENIDYAVVLISTGWLCYKSVPPLEFMRH